MHVIFIDFKKSIWRVMYRTLPKLQFLSNYENNLLVYVFFTIYNFVERPGSPKNGGLCE